jgi:hypothetical protein
MAATSTAALSAALAANGSEAESGRASALSPSPVPFSSEKSSPQYPETALTPDSMANSEDTLDSVFAALPSSPGRGECLNRELGADFSEVEVVVPLSTSESPAQSTENGFANRQAYPSSQLKSSSRACVLSGSPLNRSGAANSRGQTILRVGSVLESGQGRESRHRFSGSSPQAGERSGNRKPFARTPFRPLKLPHTI